MNNTTIYLVRHGETDWNLEGRYQGQKDIPLNQTGIRQAQIAAQTLNGNSFTALYCSDHQRNVQTAQEISKKVNLPIITNPALREINQGVWEGQYIKDVLDSMGDKVRAVYENPYSHRKPGGESIGEVAEQMYTFLDQLSEKHNQDTIIVVSPLKMTIRNIPPNASVEIVYWAKNNPSKK